MEGCLLGQGPGRRSPTEGRGLSGACLGRRRHSGQSVQGFGTSERERGGGEEGATQAVSQAGGDAVQTWVEGGQTAGLEIAHDAYVRECVRACGRGWTIGPKRGSPARVWWDPL